MPSTPRSGLGTPNSSGRYSPKIESLKVNNISIERTYKPKNVLHLTSHLLAPFSNVIPGSRFNQQWEGRGVPRDAVDWDASPESTKKKEAILEAARIIYQKCQKKIKNPPANEDPWSKLWGDILEDRIEIVSEHHGLEPCPILGQVTNTLFCKATPLYGDTKYKITLPKPDITLTFQTCGTESQLGIGSQAHEEYYCFSRSTIRGLQKDGLIASPFSDTYNHCFPWGIYEAKSTKSKSPLKPECQAANAAVKCIKLFEKLLEGPDSPSNLRIGAEDLLPIPCITCHGKVWELWVCYRDKNNNLGPSYKLERIFGGDLGDLWSCVQLVYILDRLMDWALNTFRQWIHEKLEPWVEKLRGKSQRNLSPPFGKNVKSSVTNSQETRARSSPWNHVVSPTCRGNYYGHRDSGIGCSDDGDDGDDGSGGEVSISSKNSKEMLSWRMRKAKGTGDQGGLENYSGDIPEIEAVLDVGNERTPTGLYNTKSGAGLLYHVKWKDCWSTEEYIAKFPGKYRIAAIIATGEVERHRVAHGLQLFRFSTQWVKRESFNKHELGIIDSWAQYQSFVDQTNKLRI